MNLGERIRDLREKSGLTQKELADKLKIPNQNISNYERGFRQPDFTTLSMIADFFEVSTDYLLGRTNHKKLDSEGLPVLSKKDERDIARELEAMLSDLNEKDTNALAFDGEPMDDVTRELVKESIESNLRLAKKLAKKKFTPKKYRDWE